MMTGICFSLLAGALELIVPSYALRLLRRFGANYVGRFVVVAFCSLALFHLLGLVGLPGGAFVSGFTLDLWIAVGSVLLLVGMGHLETCLGERLRLKQEQQALRSQCEQQLAKGTEDLAAANQNLLRQIARREQELKALQQSEADYRFLFAENPQPLWLLEPGSGRFVAVNHAALRLFGLSSQEFLASKPRELLRPDQHSAFLEDTARPCPAIESRGIWGFRRKNGAVLELELTALDFTFSGQPTRLFVAQDCSQRRQREFEVAQDTLSRIAGGLATHLNPVFATVVQQTNLLRSKPQDPASVEQIDRIAEATGRAAALTRELLLAGASHAFKA